MADLNGQARALAAAIDAKKAEAAAAWAEFDGLRKSAVAEGVDFAHNTEAFDRLDDASKSYDSLRDEVASLEAKRSRLVEMSAGDAPVMSGAKTAEIARTMGEAFTKSEEYRALLDSGILSRSAKFGSITPVEVADREMTKALLGTKANITRATTGDGGLGDLILEDRLAGLFPIRQEALTLLEVITTGSTDSNVVEWVYESARRAVNDGGTLGANNVSEGGDKPASDFTVEIASSKVEKIAHHMKVTREALADIAGTQTYINERLVDGVRRRLQDQIAGGGGTSPALRGIYNTSGIISHPKGSDSLIVAIHKAVTKIRTQYWAEPNAIGIHPNDWESIRLLRDDSGAGAGTGGFLFGSPALSGANTLWGLPVVVHTIFPEGNPLVGNFREAFLWVREGVSVSASDSDGDNFTKNLVTILAEMRAAFGVIYPKAFAEVTSGS
jgi:HK97 family phage major capsid protein